MEKKGIQLTPEDTAQLKEYLQALDEIGKREPEKFLTAEIFEEIAPILKATGEIPEKYRDRIGISEVEESKHHFNGDQLIIDEGTQSGKALYDIAWEKWNAETVELNKKYHDVITKGIRLALSKDKDISKVEDLLDQLVKENSPIPTILLNRLENSDIPMDKVNRKIWYLLKDTQGQERFNIDVSKQGAEKPVNLLYSIDFFALDKLDDDVKITKKLEPYDRRVYIAMGGLFKNSPYMTAQQIYNAMGYKGILSATDKEKINQAILKMNVAHIYINNMNEAKAHYRYPKFAYDGSLLPMERIQGTYNNKGVTVIHLFREPPLLTFARQRKQITTVDIKLLDTPLSKSNGNIELEDYILEEIARIKKGDRKNKMLYSTIYEETHINTIKQKQRAPEKIKRLLDYYKSCKYIADYREEKDGLTIIY